MVYGDYDVDGVTATSLLYEQLKGLGGTVKCMLPSREGDGYGLSKRAIDRIHNKGYTLIVTVDNGISAVEEASYAASLGIDVVITDHHVPPSVLPQAVAVVDPKRRDDESPFKDLCGAGVAFKLCAAFGELYARGAAGVLQRPGRHRHGGRCDAPHRGRTAPSSRRDCKACSTPSGPACAPLLEETGAGGQDGERRQRQLWHCAPAERGGAGWTAPSRPCSWCSARTPARAAGLARQLNEVNAQRQETEQKIEHAVEEMLAADPARTEDRIMLLWGQGWHQGVIGIVASRLVEKYGRPVMVVSVAENGEAKGSGRSVPGFDLHACITACADLLIRFGGHPMAAGLLVREENLPELRRRMNRVGRPGMPGDPCAAPDLRSVPPAWPGDGGGGAGGWSGWAPFGADNPPRCSFWRMRVVEGVYPVSDGKHSRLRLNQGGAGLYAVWFGMSPERVPYQPGGCSGRSPQPVGVRRGPRGPSCPGGSSTCTRRVWVRTRPGRRRWWKRCAAARP